MEELLNPLSTTIGGAHAPPIFCYTRNIVLNVPNILHWRFVKTKEVLPLPGQKEVMPNFSGKMYVHGNGRDADSFVCYFFKGKKVFCAWGKLNQKNCVAHAVKNTHGGWYKPKIGCVETLPIKKGKKIIGFSIKTVRKNINFV